jgi:hypothetical protein
MIYQPTDKFNLHRKYSGIEVGMIYLLSPGYIKWAIRDLSSFCIAEIEYLSSLKVYNLFDQGGSVTAHYAGVDQDIFRNEWASNLNFDDIKLGGHKFYSLPDDILALNEKKLLEQGYQGCKLDHVKKEEQEIFLFYPGEFMFSGVTKLWPTRIFKSSKGYMMVSFEMDNSSRTVDFLPNESRLKVYSFLLPNWNIEDEEFEMRIKKKIPFEGKIEYGYLKLNC